MYNSAVGTSTSKTLKRTSSRSPSSSHHHQMSKRSRSSNRNYNDNNNESSDSDSQEATKGGRGGAGRRSPPQSRRGGGGGGGAPYVEDYGGGRRSSSHHHHSGSGHRSSSSSYPYKVLCMSKLHPKATDDFVRDSLYREFKRYGDISVKVVNEPDERVAYVYFRSAEDAREVKHAKTPVYIYDRAVKIEAAYESSSNGGGAGAGGGYYGGRSRSSPSGGPPPPSMGHHQHPHHPGGPPPPHHYNERDAGGRYDSRGGYDHPRGGYRDYGGGGRRGQDGEYVGGGGSRGYPRSYPPGPPGAIPPPPPGPPHHHPHGPPPPHHPHYLPPPPPMQMRGGGGGHHEHPYPPAPGGGAPRYENKKDKFPNYLQHVSPEEDPLATRTLFAGNLEVNITDEELRRIFGRYGQVEDIDIKRPPPGTGNAYAFVRFVNLDMAARAKSELSGQYIGKFQCKIGYGKMNPTTKIWIGGLGQWTTLQMLEREFDRFGSIKKIDWLKGEPFAYITYETIDAAQAAVKDMRGYPLGGPDKKLRTDFADAGAPPVGTVLYHGDGGGSERGPGSEAGGGSQDGDGIDRGTNGSAMKRVSLSPRSASALTSPSHSEQEDILGGAKTVNDMAKKITPGWTGGLILKNSSFPCKFYLTDGDQDGVENLLKDEEGKAQLRITQRLRLDQSKLDDVLKRLSTSPSFAIFLSLPTSSTVIEEDGAAVQSRPLRNLVSYLKQKEAAGVISLINAKDSTLTGVLYAFPPCPFSLDLLKRTAPNLTEDANGEFLVIVVIKGAN